MRASPKIIYEVFNNSLTLRHVCIQMFMSPDAAEFLPCEIATMTNETDHPVTAERTTSPSPPADGALDAPASEALPLSSDALAPGDAAPPAGVGEGEEVPAEPAELPATDAATFDPHAALRETLRDWLTHSSRLPPVLRQRLAELVEGAEAAADGSEMPSLRLADAARLFEQSLPAHLLVAAGETDELAHSGGDDYFRDASAGPSDADARALAAGQLARSGFGRK